MLIELLELLYPRICVACNEALLNTEPDLCLACQSTIPKISTQPENRKTLEQLFYGRIPFDFVVALYSFDKKGMVQRIIHHIKYNNAINLAYLLGIWLGEEMLSNQIHWSGDYVVPVPLHIKKLKQRGYNQSASFAKGLAQKLQIPLHTHLLHRTQHTRSQTGMNKIRRWENVKNAFQCSIDLSGKTIILADDVLTTGSTIEACSRALTNAGAQTVNVAVMASAFTH